MLAENILFLAVFISSSGLAVIGILVSYQQFKENQIDAFQILLYQQIFLFSFFIYSIWANLALRAIVSEVNPDSQILARLEFFVPLPGLPFLIISWFMLLKFGFNLNGSKITKRWTYFYFTGSFSALWVAVYLYHAGNLSAPSDPDSFLLRLFVSFNLFAHLIFLFPFLKSKTKKVLYIESKKIIRSMILYLAATGIYSVLLWFSGYLGNAGTAVSLLLLFFSSALLPLSLKFLAPVTKPKNVKPPDTFETFCSEFRISKREAEIVLEICAGKTNKAIAEKLFITLQTVKDHTHRIYTKTQVKNRIQLANLVIEKTGKERKNLKGT
jgi:DNA-binding CsgD family transcriptional regulator